MLDDPVVPNSTDAAIARIRAWAAGMGLSKSALAIRAGMASTVLRHFDRHDWNPTVETLRKLEALIPEGWHPGDALAGAGDTTGEAA